MTIEKDGECDCDRQRLIQWVCRLDATELDLLGALSLHNTSRAGVSAGPGMQPQRTAYTLQGAIPFHLRRTNAAASISESPPRHTYLPFNVTRSLQSFYDVCSKSII
ncbi:hypothetical protein MSG28_001778 [Choristoneura fumiferana]|uniref:Uncharacterized protein n=1 Tax=Choristoneura fumiferana TaxID=7141 RepID=A0ACC0KW45_CHOFU|nr:hypothetical protein MSG28_001778 [Choristoneura fumiferana]